MTCHMAEGRSRRGAGDVSEKEAQGRRHCGPRAQSPPQGAGPHQALHTPRHLTAMFRSGETCPEAGSKRALPSDKRGALPPATGFPLEIVRVRGQADPCTHRKCDGAPWRKVGTVSGALGAPLLCRQGSEGMGAWLSPEPLKAGERPGRIARWTLRHTPGRRPAYQGAG